MDVRFRRQGRRARERGQALPRAAVLMAAGAAAMYLAFNASQLVHAKTKLQDTADAAAYSVGVLQARDLNFAAYTNRAMIANQVATAQMISIKSWIDEVDGTYKNDHWFDTLIQSTVTPNQLWTIPKKTLGREVSLAKRVLDRATTIATLGLDQLESVLSLEQSAYHGAIALQIPLVAEEIAQANEPNTHVSKTYFATRGALSLSSALGFLSKNTPQGKTGKDRFADVLTDKATLDEFVKQRGVNIRTPMVPVGMVQGCPESFVTATNWHAGGTQLRQDKKGWEGLDATDVNGVWICVVEVFPIIIPLKWTAGSGGAANGPGGRYSGRTGYGGYKDYGGSLTNMLTTLAANSQYKSGPGKSLSRSGGLQPYLELKTQSTPANGADFNRAPTLVIEAQRASPSINTTDRLQIAQGSLAVSDGTASQQMRAMSSASAYFIRPGDSGGVAGALRNAANWRRGDNKWEYPSVFNPYWQSSLVETSTLALTAGDAAQASGAP